jgi:hypothetical protein
MLIFTALIALCFGNSDYNRFLLPGGGKLLSLFKPYGSCSFFATTKAIGAFSSGDMSFYQDIRQVVQNPSAKPGCVGLLTLDQRVFWMVVGGTDGSISFAQANQTEDCNSKFVLQPALLVEKPSEKVFSLSLFGFSCLKSQKSGLLSIPQERQQF